MTLLPLFQAVVGSYFITKEEERVLGIQEQVTTSWRRQDNIPDSDGFEVYLQDPQGNRSDTISTAKSNKNNRKRHKLGAYKSR